MISRALCSSKSSTRTRSKRANVFAARKVHWTLRLSGSALRIAFSRYALSEKAGHRANTLQNAENVPAFVPFLVDLGNKSKNVASALRFKHSGRLARYSTTPLEMSSRATSRYSLAVLCSGAKIVIGTAATVESGSLIEREITECNTRPWKAS